MPIINENDAIASDEIRYGDNDRIAALVGHNDAADVLVLLTDLDGLYTADPRARRRRRAGRAVRADDPLLSIRAGARRQRAGQRRHGQQAGGGADRVVVRRAHGDRQRRPAGVLAGGGRRTSRSARRSTAHDRQLPARKLWIAFASEVAGTVTVDDGARRALVERQTSLLPAGVVEVAGRFAEGDTVDVARRRRRGVRPRHGVRRAAQLRARRRASTRATCPPGMAHEVIHRDDLVLLPA